LERNSRKSGYCLGRASLPHILPTVERAPAEGTASPMNTPLFTASEAAGFRSFTVVDGEALVLRAPTPYPIRTAFGTMHDRPAVLVRIADDAGTVGWGEVWCNFPSVGAEHRARLLNSILLPLLKGKTVENPEAIFAELSSRTRLLA